jgi:hypothetical protein
VLHEEDEGQDVVVVELNDPVYDANADTLTFAATVLTDEQTGALAAYSDKVDAALPAAFNACSVLIDDAPVGCGIAVWMDAYQYQDRVFIENIYRTGMGPPYAQWLYPGQTFNLGDGVISFTITKYSDPPSRVTINFTGQAGMSYNLVLSAFLVDELPPGFTREGTWTAPFNELP